MTETFHVESLLEEARRRTGLEDFGDPSFRDGLEVLARSLEEEARLGESGRAAWRSQILGYLVERLRIEDWYRRHPEIDAQVVRAPIVVTGLPRTGTTALSNLLAQDPEARSLRFWESLRPTPPPEAATQDTDPRIAEADAMLEGMKAAAPDLAKMHDDNGRSPTENQDLLGQHFRTLHFDGMARVPAYVEWWLSCDMVPAYRHHRRVLKLLQWRCPPYRWNLKNPPDLFCLEAVTAVYPDARIVWTHRDPAKVLPSVCSLVATVRSIFSPEVDRHELGRAQLRLWAEAVRRGMEFRDRVGEERFVDVRMEELVSDPIVAVARIYDRFGLVLGEEAQKRMRLWLAENPQGKHGAHRYDLADFGLRLGEVREAFLPYVRRFAVRIEA
ncbi:MAG: putative sulfotransferase [Candidatus Binatia bacterium]|nr:MAG: putative sulfotransferase [Candidatus Binatia bacterium]